MLLCTTVIVVVVTSIGKSKFHDHDTAIDGMCYRNGSQAAAGVVMAAGQAEAAQCCAQCTNAAALCGPAPAILHHIGGLLRRHGRRISGLAIVGHGLAV